MTSFHRFAAFVSYSSRDASFAKRLHSALESYAIPAALGRFDLIGGGKPNRIYPVFRDREELGAGEIGPRIEAALSASANLIVVCSPYSAASIWVEKEIQFFISLGRRDRIFTIIAADAPLQDALGNDSTASCFSPAFQRQAVSEGRGLEPLAADARPGKDGFRNAHLKIVAGIIGVNAGSLQDRDRRRRRARAIAGTGAGVLATLSALVAVGVADVLSDRLEWEGLARAAAEGPSSYAASSYAVAALAPLDAVVFTNSPGALEAAALAGLELPLLAVLGQGSSLGVSQDGKRVLFQSLDGNHYSFERDAAPGQRLKNLGELRIAKMTPDGTKVVAQHWSGELLLFGSDNRPESLGNMELARTFELKEGNVLLAEDEKGDVRFVDLKRKATVRLVLNDTHYKVEVSRDGSMAVVQDRKEQLHFVDILNGTTKIVVSGNFYWEISPDGRLLFLRGKDGLYTAHDPKTGAPVPIEPVNQINYDFGGPGSLVILVRDRGPELIRTDGMSRARFNPGSTLTFDYSGSTLRLLDGGSISVFLGVGPETKASELSDRGRWKDVTEFLEGAEAVSQPDDAEHLLFRLAKQTDSIDVLNLIDGTMVPLGSHGDLDPYMPFGLSRDGTRLFLHPNIGFRSILEVESRSLVKLLKHNGLALRANDFSTLVLTSTDLVVSVWDGATTFGNRSLSASEICKASPGIPQFAPDERARRRSLTGRPWHPCDWRGIGAIVPDQQQGDGWFEGPRQFARRIGVLYFGAPDYLCEEVVSGANERTRAFRMEGCRLVSSARTIGVSR